MAETKEETLADFAPDRLLKRDFLEDKTAHDEAINAVPWDALEAMDSAKTYDSVSRETKNGLTDSATSTIYHERAARVVGQLPEGEVQAFGKKDRGKAMFMDLIRTNWIYPNANAQRSFKVKLYLWKYKASVYNWYPVYYDLHNSPSGYFGPDFWLWNPRNFIPQNGQVTVADMDYVHALAYKSPQWFEDELEDEDSTYDKEVLREISALVKNKTRGKDTDRQTKKQREQATEPRQIQIATRYEAGEDGRWITFLPEYGYRIIRDIKNPHENGKIPFVVLHGIPDDSSFYGVGDFERSMPMQFANDGLDNFYFEGIKRNLYPATHVNAQAMIMHTWSQEPGALIQWNGTPEMKTGDTSTAGLSTYQAAKGMAKGAIQSIAGTTDTRLNAESAMDPGFAKTPEGLRQIAAREDTRDSQDRDIFEEAVAELIDGMLSIVPTVPTKVPVDLLQEEVAEIAKLHPDVLGLFRETKSGKTVKNPDSDLIKSGLVTPSVSTSEEQVRLHIDASKLKGLEYRFQLKPGSTQKKTKEQQLQAFMDWLGFIGKMPNMLDKMEAQGKTLNWEKINEIYSSLTDIPGMDELFTNAPQQQEIDPAEQPEGMEPQPGAPQVAPMEPPQTGMPINPATGQPYSPEIAAEVQRAEAMRGAA